MTVTELMINFRAGLLGLLPSVEQAGIPWKRPDTYDVWDNIVTAIYQALIVDSLCNKLPEADQENFKLPEYDLLIPNYAGRTIIELLPPGPDGIVRVFHALGTAKSPFDIVEWRAVGQTGSPKSDKLEQSSFREK